MQTRAEGLDGEEHRMVGAKEVSGLMKQTLKCIYIALSLWNKVGGSRNVCATRKHWQSCNGRCDGLASTGRVSNGYMWAPQEGQEVKTRMGAAFDLKWQLRCVQPIYGTEQQVYWEFRIQGLIIDLPLSTVAGVCYRPFISVAMWTTPSWNNCVTNTCSHIGLMAPGQRANNRTAAVKIFEGSWA